MDQRRVHWAGFIGFGRAVVDIDCGKVTENGGGLQRRTLHAATDRSRYGRALRWDCRLRTYTNGDKGNVEQRSASFRCAPHDHLSRRRQPGRDGRSLEVLSGCVRQRGGVARAIMASMARPMRHLTLTQRCGQKRAASICTSSSGRLTWPGCQPIFVGITAWIPSSRSSLR